MLQTILSLFRFVSPFEQLLGSFQEKEKYGFNSKSDFIWLSFQILNANQKQINRKVEK